MARSGRKFPCDRVLKYVACQKPESGLFSVLNYAAGQVLVPCGQAEGEGYDPYKTACEDPFDEPVTRAYQFLDEDQQITPWSYTKLFAKQFETPSGVAITPYPDSHVHKKGTCYSGEMRRVVQMLAGKKQEIAYEYGWPKTHGIFVNAITEKRWVIEVEGSGVTAWKLPVCSRPADFPEGALPYIPKAVSALPSFDSRRLLCDASEVAPAYLGSPLSQQIGWAFSDTGHEIMHVIDVGGFISPVNGLPYSKNFLYRIDVATDQDGDPISASMTEVESEWNFHEWLQNNIRVWEYFSCGIGLRRWTKVTPSQPNPPVNESYSFPVHVYWKAGGWKVFRYNRGHPVVTTEPANPFPYASGRQFSEDPADNGIVYSDFTRTITRWTVTIDGIESGLGNACAQQGSYNKEHISSARFNIQTEHETYNNPMAGAEGSLDMISGSYVVLRREQFVNATYYDDCIWSFIVPASEREGYMFATGTRVGVDAENKNLWQDWAEHTSQHRYPGSCTPDGNPKTWLGGSNRYTVIYEICSDDNCDGYDPCVTGGADPCPPVLEPLYKWEQPRGSQYWINLDGPHYETDTGPCNNGQYIEYSVYYNQLDLVFIADKLKNGEPDTPDVVYDETNDLNFVYYDGSTVKVAAMEYTPTIFSGDINDDNSSCQFSNPWWMGAYMDAFDTGRGWISPNADAEGGPLGQDVQLVGNVGSYDVTGKPVSNRTSGWLGLPFPGDFS